MLRASLVAGLSVLSTFLAATHASPVHVQDSDLKKALPDAEGIKKSGRKLDKAGRERIEKALGTKLEDKDIPLIWECRATVHSASSSDKVRVLYCVVTARGAKGDVRIAVAVAPDEERLAVVKVLDNKDEKALEDATFLQQFEGFEYAASLEKPASSLEEARAKGKAPSDAATRELGAFLALTERMHGVQAEFDALQGRIAQNKDDAIDPAKRLHAAFGDVEKMTPSFSGFLQKSQIDRFAQSTRASQKDVDAAIGAIKEKKWTDAAAAVSRLANDQCNRCHASLRSRFTDRRADLGIGNGYFVIGHELTAPAEASREAAQGVATAVRRAVLILTGVK
jgi:hypothetical protein